MPLEENIFLKAFENPEAVARYSEGPRRFVPGLDALHRMTTLLLAERAPQGARILVLGAGGGSEIAAMAAAQPSWHFTGVDPAAEMLRLAERVLAPVAHRTSLIKGYIEDAPEGPFDGATCMLTLHFLDAAERTRTVREVHRRLKPGAAFVAAHASFPQEKPARSLWLDRYVAYPVAMGADPLEVAKAREAVAAHVSILSPDEDEAVLRNAGFGQVTPFFTALTWRGWVAYA
ncbi:MAG TPA: class I SAM-dependent methyltransferase [Micropepsaceae bacterium]|nr:class I SAM-dependent methyltransferase [Micropepsaceae bacterium]